MNLQNDNHSNDAALVYDLGMLVDLAERLQSQPHFKQPGAPAATPSAVSGRVIVREVQPGLLITSYRVTYLHALELCAKPEYSFTCGINIDGPPAHMEVEGLGDICYERQQLVIMGFDGDRACRSQHRQGIHSSVAGITVKPEFVDGLVAGSERDTFAQLLDNRVAVVLSPSPRFVDMAYRLLDETYCGALCHLHQNSCALGMAAELGRLAAGYTRTGEASGRRGVERARYARHLLDVNIIDTPTLASLSRTIGVNVTTLQRDFQLEYGQTIFDYVRDQRLALARALVTTSDLPISQVGFRVGYRSPAAFSTAYRRKFGLAPKLDRRRRCVD